MTTVPISQKMSGAMVERSTCGLSTRQERTLTSRTSGWPSRIRRTRATPSLPNRCATDIRRSCENSSKRVCSMARIWSPTSRQVSGEWMHGCELTTFQSEGLRVKPSSGDWAA